MSLRDRLTAKARRRAVVPIAVEDFSADQQTLTGTVVALQNAQSREGTQPEEIATLTAAVQSASEAVRSHFVEVELQSLSSDDWEAAQARWSDGETVDWASALAPLLAESCVDEDLRDETFWQERLADPAWSAGDRDALRIALLRLNVVAADPIVPKG